MRFQILEQITHTRTIFLILSPSLFDTQKCPFHGWPNILSSPSIFNVPCKMHPCRITQEKRRKNLFLSPLNVSPARKSAEKNFFLSKSAWNDLFLSFHINLQHFGSRKITFRNGFNLQNKNPFNLSTNICKNCCNSTVSTAYPLAIRTKHLFLHHNLSFSSFPSIHFACKKDKIMFLVAIGLQRWHDALF